MDELEGVEKMKVVGKLSPEQYWKWRLTIEELAHAKTKENMLQLDCVVKKLQIENSKKELLIATQKFTEGKKVVEMAKEELAKDRMDIETDLGIELKNCVIDEYSFEVKELPEEE